MDTDKAATGRLADREGEPWADWTAGRQTGQFADHTEATVLVYLSD